MSKQTELLKQVSAKVRKRGIKPFTKAFGKAMKAEFKKLKKSRGAGPKKSKKGGGKRRKSANKRTKATKRKTSSKKSMAKNKGGKKGKSGMSRLKKVLLGLGVGAAVSTIAAFSRQPAVESAGPIVDALAGGGWEAQVGTAIPRLIRTFAQGNFSNGNGGNGGMAAEGA